MCACVCVRVRACACVCVCFIGTYIYTHIHKCTHRALVQISREFDRPGILGFVTFILPLILDGLFNGLYSHKSYT
jgi:hypothetical protein